MVTYSTLVTNVLLALIAYGILIQSSSGRLTIKIIYKSLFSFGLLYLLYQFLFVVPWLATIAVDFWKSDFGSILVSIFGFTCLAYSVKNALKTGVIVVNNQTFRSITKVFVYTTIAVVIVAVILILYSLFR